ncbi:MAG TPA: MBL fold metallo-hydrolase [Malonomonas sp.]
MSIKLTILCENSVERVTPGGLIGEHGFACHLQTEQGDYLFDTGSGLGLLNNSERLAIDLSQLQGIILSHGHRDHTGGLRQLLEATGPTPIYAHPDLFSQRHSLNGGELRAAGIPWEQSELEGCGGIFRLSAAPQQITPQLTASGEIPRSETTAGDRNLLVIAADGSHTIDPLADDQSLYINTPQGLVILLGCAHAGLFNIIDHAIQLTGQRRIRLLLGGTHLKFCSAQQLTDTIERLADYQLEAIGAAHCTGLQQAQKLAERFGERFFFASVGTQLDL